VSDFLDSEKSFALGSFLDTVFAIMEVVDKAVFAEAAIGSVRETECVASPRQWDVHRVWGTTPTSKNRLCIYKDTACHRLAPPEIPAPQSKIVPERFDFILEDSVSIPSSLCYN
jgi:hypothetical protein